MRYGIPDQHRVGEQAQTADFVHNLLGVASAKNPLIRKEEPTREPMACLPAVELQLDTACEYHRNRQLRDTLISLIFLCVKTYHKCSI